MSYTACGWQPESLGEERTAYTLHKKVKDINILNFLVPFIYATRARIACINYTKKVKDIYSYH